MKKSMLSIGLAVACALTCTAGWNGETGVWATSSGMSGNTTVNVIVETPPPPPRYQLMEGVRVAIENVRASGRPVTVESVLKELEDMQDANDVALPYHYYKASTTGKNNRGFLRGDQKQKYIEFKTKVDTVIKKMYGDAPNANSVLDPRKYKTEKAFADAYVDYMTENITEEEKLKWKGRIDGIRGFQRQKRAEALKIYRAGKKK